VVVSKAVRATDQRRHGGLVRRPEGQGLKDLGVGAGARPALAALPLADDGVAVPDDAGELAQGVAVGEPYAAQLVAVSTRSRRR